MSDLKIGDKINHVSVSLNIDMSTKEIKIKSSKVLGISKHFYCLDDDYFSKLARTKTFEFGYAKLNKVSISEEKSDTMVKYFGRFKISIYSTSSLKVIENKINREFKKWLDKKISVYGVARNINIKLATGE